MNSKSWVSHTPETKPKDEQELEEDFASVAESDYRPPSPPSTFEKFFLPFEATTGAHSSPLALAARRINRNTTTSRKLVSHSIASESVVTEDFASAADDLSETSDLDDISLDDSLRKSSLFNDILGRQTILEETPELDYEIETNMEPTKSSKKKKNMTKKVSPTPVETLSPDPAVTAPIEEQKPEENKSKFDVVDNIYEGAKSVWAFGKCIIVFKPFMGVAEGAATKVLSITTGISSLEDADKHIKTTLSGLDQEFIDPAILRLWSVLEPVIGKGDEVLKTVLTVVSKKVPMLKGEKTKECDEASAPEISKPCVTA